MSDNRVLIILQRLARPGACLARVDQPAESSESAPAYRVISDNPNAGRTPAVPSEEVRRWLSEGLIERCEKGYSLSSAGKSWLRRRLASAQDFQSQHQTRKTKIIDFEGVKRPAVVNEAESPLAWLASRKDRTGAPLISALQLEAGERLRADYQFAGLTARVTASWNPAASGGAGDSVQNTAAALQDHILAARQRVVRAIAAVGPELCGVLIDVCCHLKGIEEAEKTEGLPQRSGKVVLQIALTRLARHYGLVSDAELTARVRRKLIHWGAEDYRPKIGGDAAS